MAGLRRDSVLIPSPQAYKTPPAPQDPLFWQDMLDRVRHVMSFFATRAPSPDELAALVPTSVMDENPQLAQSGLDKMLSLALGGVTVFHGSPYKFNKFDSAKIGTGEGAQAYGYGHYLAENPRVAMEYRKTLTENTPAAMTRAELQDQISSLAHQSDIARSSGNHALADDLLSKANQLDQQLTSTANPGGLYTVDLPDEAAAKMLDWDKQITQQEKYVRDAFESVGLTGQRGQDIYKGLVKSTGSHAAASDYLRSIGIPGIKYLDQGSRAAGKGTYNYVVFPGNEHLMKITGRK